MDRFQRDYLHVAVVSTFFEKSLAQVSWDVDAVLNYPIYCSSQFSGKNGKKASRKAKNNY